MSSVKYVYWQDEDAWLGYLGEFPDYWSQGEDLDDLLEHLKDLYIDLTTSVSGLESSITRLNLNSWAANADPHLLG